ncbi:MAG: toxin-antitoxin system HicB family antitoxin [Granulosicoccus sp.]
MSTMTVRLPESLHEKIKQLAQDEGISINQFLVVAAAEKMSALMTEDYLHNEAKKGNRQDSDSFMGKVPDVDPGKQDSL